jgi:hypothetical protein
MCFSQSACASHEVIVTRASQFQKLIAANDKRFDLFVIGSDGRLQRLDDDLCGQTLPGASSARSPETSTADETMQPNGHSAGLRFL